MRNVMSERCVKEDTLRSSCVRRMDVGDDWDVRGEMEMMFRDFNWC